MKAHDAQVSDPDDDYTGREPHDSNSSGGPDFAHSDVDAIPQSFAYRPAYEPPLLVKDLQINELTSAIGNRDLTPMVEYAQSVAAERFAAGYELAEVQTAFNALEEATWTRMLEAVPRSQISP